MRFFRDYPPHRGFNAAPEINRLTDENAALRARIAELEKAREPIDTGWVIVSPLSDGRLMCHNVHDLAADAWEEYGAHTMGDRQYEEANGYRAVKVAVVRVEE
jgi:hypothetical protein